MLQKGIQVLMGKVKLCDHILSFSLKRDVFQVSDIVRYITEVNGTVASDRACQVIFFGM